MDRAKTLKLFEDYCNNYCNVAEKHKDIKDVEDKCDLCPLMEQVEELFDELEA